MTRIKMPYSSNLHTVIANDAIYWCKDKFGEHFYPLQLGDRRWSYAGMGEFVFKQEEDAVLFALRWA